MFSVKKIVISLFEDIYDINSLKLIDYLSLTQLGPYVHCHLCQKMMKTSILTTIHKSTFRMILHQIYRTSALSLGFRNE